MADILFELGCEELPPKALYGLSKALFNGVEKQLQEAGFAWQQDDSRWFASRGAWRSSCTASMNNWRIKKLKNAVLPWQRHLMRLAKPNQRPWALPVLWAWTYRI